MPSRMDLILQVLADMRNREDEEARVQELKQELIAKAVRGAPEGYEFSGMYPGMDVPRYEEKGLETPYIDPTMVMSGVAGAGLKTGIGLGRLAGRAGLAGAAEFPIGMATELAPVPEPVRPWLNVGLGVASGIWPETAIEKAIARYGGRIAAKLRLGQFDDEAMSIIGKETGKEAAKPPSPLGRQEPPPVTPKAEPVQPQKPLEKKVGPKKPLVGVAEKKAGQAWARINTKLGADLDRVDIKEGKPLFTFEEKRTGARITIDELDMRKYEEALPTARKIAKGEKVAERAAEKAEKLAEYRPIYDEAKKLGYNDEEIMGAARIVKAKIEGRVSSELGAKQGASRSNLKAWDRFIESKGKVEVGKLGGVQAIEHDRSDFMRSLRPARELIKKDKEGLPGWVTEGVEKPKKGEAGFINPQVASHLAGAGIGALAGYAADDENPIRGALIGAAIGTASPKAIKGVIKALKRDPDALGKLAKVKITNNTVHKIVDASLAANKTPDEIIRAMSEANKKYKIKLDLNEATSYINSLNLAKKLAGTLRKPTTEKIKKLAEREVPEKTKFTKTGKTEAVLIKSINYNQIDSEGALKVIDELAERIPEREVRPLKITEQLARDFPWAEHEIIKTKITKDLDVKVTAARMVNAGTAERAWKVAEKVGKSVTADNPTNDQLIEYIVAEERALEVLRAVGGMASNLGRGLGAQRIPIRNTDIRTQAMEEILKNFGGREATMERMKMIAKLPWDDPDNFIAAFNKFILDSVDAKFSDQVYEAWINALLSSPVTHAVNATSNTLTFLGKYPEKLAAASIDLFRGKNRERFFGEVFNKHELFGIGKGFTDGIRKAIVAFNTEMPSQRWGKLARVTKIETYHPAAIKGPLGKGVRIPGRFLMAADEFFKALNYHSELAGLAYRKATKAGKTGADRAKMIGEILADPKELKGIAEQDMLYRVFQQELGSFGKLTQRLRAWEPLAEQGYSVKPLGYIMPFLRTPVNIAKFGLERTPLNFIRIAFKSATGGFKGSQISDEMAKTMVGTMIGAGIFMAAKEGHFTGLGPKKKSEREAWYREGNLPYSFKWGDKRYSYQRLEPLGSIIGMAADFAEGFEEMSDEDRAALAGRIVKSIARNIFSKTFMKGLSDALNAAMDPERYGERWLAQFGSTLVAPRVVSTLARATDPYLRRPKGFVETFKAQYPGLRQQKLPTRNLWGERIEVEGTVAGKLISPVRVSKAKGDKIDRVISDLNTRGFARFSLPGKTIRTARELIKFTPREYDRLVEEAGKRAKKKLDRIVARSGFDRMSDSQKERIIRKAINNARSIIRTRIIRDRRKKKRLVAVNE